MGFAFDSAQATLTSWPVIEEFRWLSGIEATFGHLEITDMITG